MQRNATHHRALRCTTVCQSGARTRIAHFADALLSLPLIRAACAAVAGPRRVSTSGGFPRFPPLSPSRPNRDALYAVKHLARASSCLYVAAYILSLSLSLSFHDLLSLSSHRTLGSHLRLSLSFSIILFLLSFHPHMRQTSRYLLDILRTFAPLRFEFLTRFPSQISLSPCSFRCTRTISSKRCSVIRHGFHGEHGLLFFLVPLPLHR